MNLMEKGITRYLTSNQLQKLQTPKIAIFGCGGIGSNAVVNLVRLGFKRFKLIDFDKIDYSNLNRQFYFFNQVGEVKTSALKDNLLKINPDLDITISNLHIQKENILDQVSDCSYVIEGFDKPEYKKLVIEKLSGTIPVISSNGLGDRWMVDDIKTHRITDNLTIVGDLKSDTDGGLSPTSPGVLITASKMAAALLERIIGDVSV